jgi:hypothetical protein
MFLVLLTYNDCPDIFVRQEVLAKNAGMSRFKANKVLNSLAEKGYIEMSQDHRYKTKIYHILKKALVTLSDNTVTQDDTSCHSRLQVPVTHSDTNKYNINKNKLIKEKKKKDDTALAVRCIKLFNKIATGRKDVNNFANQKLCKAVITELRTSGVKEDDDILAKFEYVYTNQKLIADDPAEFWGKKHYKFDTLTAKTNFFKYLDADPHNPMQGVRKIRELK